MTALAWLEERETWTAAYLTDQLFYNLVSYDTYPEQARTLFRKIPLRRQHAPFVIRLADLSPRIQKELSECTMWGRRDAFREAVARLFDDVDYFYSRLSIRPFLVVRLVNE